MKKTAQHTKYSHHQLAGKLCLIILLLATGITASAQSRQVTGQLKSTSGELVASASVLLRNSQGLVLNFCNSDNNGRYVLTLPDSSGTTLLHIEINHLGYKKVQQSITDNKTVYDFLLEKKVAELPEVEVKSKPVVDLRGDTLSYNVASFSRPEDRSIGDVMKRMPGIEIAENGEIFYNGKSTNFFIDGDNLLDGRYGLALKTISKELIKNVEVLRNHQPVKVLQNRVFTDNVSINLVLKDENSLKLSGQVMLGGGLPEQFDGALNTILLNKKYKMLNVLKANNSGIDYNDDFQQFGATSFLESMDNSRPGALLSAGTAGKPDLPKRNYYLNRSAVINANNLVNTKNGWQFRVNMQGFVDRNTLDYSSYVENYLANDTIRYSELQQAVNKPFVFNTAFTATANTSKAYFNNRLQFNLGGGSKNSYLDFNQTGFNQRLRERTYDIANDFGWIPLLKSKNVMEIRWYMNYYNNPQRLYVGSGLNSDILNNGEPFDAITQNAKTPTFFSNATVSYRVLNRLISQSYKIGVINERQQLNSDLLLTQTDKSITPYDGDAGNDLHWQRDRIYLNSTFEIKRANWNASLSAPLYWQSIRYYQDVYALDKKENRFFINPVANINFYLNAEDYIALNYRYSNNVGNISGVYRGAILTNYRSLYANDADLQEQNSSGLGIKYNFQRAVVMFFANAAITYNRVKVNSILSSVITDNVQRSVLLPYENDQNVLAASAGLSKYLFTLRTTVSLKSVFSRGRYNQFINNEMLPFNNNSMSFTAGIDNKLFRVIGFNYNGTGTWQTSKQRDKGSNLVNKVKRFDQAVSLTYSPFKNVFLTTKGRHVYTTQANVSDISYLFMDANVRYKHVKWRTDFELDVTNIANVRRYEVFHLNSNLFAVNSYNLRGRMLIARATFNL
ncbi:MAG: TonB-dependent receptor [Chitinophagaceae bacterium]